MEMSGQKLIPETRETVWKALNDPAILRSCVPGCQSLEKTSDTEMTATAAIKVGPISAKFGGSISLSELNAPISYRITGEGKGGVAGFAKGSADIKLDEVDGGTLLTYNVTAQVGGKLAQLGGRLIDATARKLSEAFFEKFATEIGRQYHGIGDLTPAENQTLRAGAPNTATPAQVTPPGQTSAGPATQVGYAAPNAPQRAGYHLATTAALALAALFAFLWLTDRQAGPPVLADPQALSPEFNSAVQLILIAAVGFLFGRLSDRRG